MLNIPSLTGAFRLPTIHLPAIRLPKVGAVGQARALAVAGLGLLTSGIGLVSVPAALIVAGLVCLAVAAGIAYLAGGGR